MSIDKDPEVYKLLVGAVMALLGILHMVGMGNLNNIKNNVRTLFERVNKTDIGLAENSTNIGHLQEDVRELKENCRDNHRG